MVVFSLPLSNLDYAKSPLASIICLNMIPYWSKIKVCRIYFPSVTIAGAVVVNAPKIVWLASCFWCRCPFNIKLTGRLLSPSRVLTLGTRALVQNTNISQWQLTSVILTLHYDNSITDGIWPKHLLIFNTDNCLVACHLVCFRDRRRVLNYCFWIKGDLTVKSCQRSSSASWHSWHSLTTLLYSR